jgi:hypothetical protein
VTDISAIEDAFGKEIILWGGGLNNAVHGKW